MHTSTRLGIDIIDSSDNVSSYPTVNAQAMGVLDDAVTITEGALASRPAASSVPYGTVYYATDKTTYYQSNGSAWGTVLITGAWSDLTLGTGVAADSGDYTPAARIEGDILRLRGTIQSSNSISGGTTIFTLPSSSMYPAASASVFVNAIEAGGGSASACLLEFNTNGTVALSSAGGGWTALYVIALNSITFTLS